MNEKLQEYRKGIDRCDDVIIAALKERFEWTEKVGILKAKEGLPPMDPSREDAQEKKLEEKWGQEYPDVAFIKELFNLIKTEVKRNHKKIAEENLH